MLDVYVASLMYEHAVLMYKLTSHTTPNKPVTCFEHICMTHDLYTLTPCDNAKALYALDVQ